MPGVFRVTLLESGTLPPETVLAPPLPTGVPLQLALAETGKGAVPVASGVALLSVAESCTGVPVLTGTRDERVVLIDGFVLTISCSLVQRLAAVLLLPSPL